MVAHSSMPKPTIESAMRQALSDKRTSASLMAALGWDSSQASKFLSGQMGLTIEKIDIAMRELGMVITSRKYMDFLAYGSQIGTACECARTGQMPCGGSYSV